MKKVDRVCFYLMGKLVMLKVDVELLLPALRVGGLVYK